MNQRESRSKAVSLLCASFALLVSLLSVSAHSQDPPLPAPVATASSVPATPLEMELDSTEPDPERCQRLESELASNPRDLHLMAELMRNLVHLANLGDLAEEERKAAYTRGTEIAEQAMALLHGSQLGAQQGGQQGGLQLKWKFRDELAVQARGSTSAGSTSGESTLGGVLHYWAAMVWGGWGDVHGAFPALRAGVADRLRLHGHLALELAPDYDWAGPYRFLGRMHAVAPKVPLFTGWIDRKVGQQLLEEAYARAPEHPQNQLFLAESWIDQEPETKLDEAEELLQHLLQSEPRPGHTTLDRRTREEARKTMEELP